MKHGLRRVLTSKYFFIPAAVLLTYTLVGFVLAPLTIRWYVPKYVRENLQGQAILSDVRINPYLLTFEAGGFNLSQTDGAPIASFERLFVDFETSSLFHWAAVFRELRMDKPALHVVFEPDGRTNLQNLAPAPAPSPASGSQDPPKTDSKPLRMLLENIAIQGGKFTITDRRQSEPANVNVETFDLNLKNLSTLQDRDGRCSFKASTPDGETIEWEGDVTLAPLRSSGKLTLSSIRTETLWEFVRDNFNLASPKGHLDVTTDYRFDASTPSLQLALEGLRVGLSDLSLKLLDSDKALLEMNRIELDAARFDLATKALQFGKLLVDGGSVDVRIDQSGLVNLQQIARQTRPKQPEAEKTPPPDPTPGSTPDAAPQTGNAAPFTMNADSIEIKNIAIAMVDSSRASPVSAGISSLDLSFKANLELGAKEPKVSLQAISSQLKSVHLASQQEPEPLFHTDTLTLEGGECDLGGRSLTVSRIALGNGHVDAILDKEGQINWAQLFAPNGAPGQASEPKPAAGPGTPWKFLVKSFEIEGFRSKLSDLKAMPEKPLLNLQGFTVKVTDIDGKSPMGFKVGFQVEQGGSVAVSGSVAPSIPSVEADVNVTGLVLTPMQPYLEPFITLVLRSAAVSTQGKLRFGPPESGTRLSYEGGFSLNQLSLSEPDSKETYLGFDAMRIPQLKLTLQPNGYEAAEITISKLIGELIIAEDQSVNLAKVVKKREGSDKDSAPAKPSAGDGQDAFPFRIGKVRVENGNTVFADLSLLPKFMARIHDLKGTVTGLSSAKDTVTKIQLDGKVDQYGLAKINGDMRLYDFKRSANIDMVFRNLEMTKLSPYSGKFAGRRIKSGKLSMDLKYQIQDGKLVGDNKIIVDNLFLGEKVESKDAVNLPLDLAVALMKDSNGRIDIGLPVTGDLANPQFSIGPLIWKAFVTLITRAVTAPFRALGALFGGEDKKFDAVEFDPGKAELPPPEMEKLKKLAEALNKRPELKLVIQGRYSPEADGMEFKELSVRRAVATRTEVKLKAEDDPGPPDFGDSKTRRALADMYQERFGKPALKELEEGISKGTIKPRTAESQKEEKAKGKKKGGFSRIVNGLKLYKVVPGGKSSEEAAAFAGELYIRLVESEPVSEEALLRLASDRARSIAREIETSGGIPAARLAIKDPDPATAGDAEPSAKLTLDAI